MYMVLAEPWMQTAKPLPDRGVRTLVQFWVREPEEVLTKELEVRTLELTFDMAMKPDLPMAKKPDLPMAKKPENMAMKPD